MIVDRYFYHCLTKGEKIVYKLVYEGIMQHKNLIPVPSEHLSEGSFERIFYAVTTDNPLLYYCNHSVMNLAQDQLGNVAFCPQYYFKEDQVKEHNKRIQQAANQIIADLKLTEGSDYEKVVKLNDYFCKNIEYDEEGANMTDVTRVIMSHNILGVFAQKRAQCEGIAKAVKVLLNAVDVKCIVADGVALRSDGSQCLHAWNIIKQDGVPYHVDITFNMGHTTNGNIGYDWLNLSDELMKGNHIPDYKLPECPTDQLNYYRVNKAVFSSKRKAEEYVKREIKRGKRLLYMRFTGGLKTSDRYAELVQVMNQAMQDYGKEDERTMQISSAVGVETNTLRVWVR